MVRKRVAGGVPLSLRELYRLIWRGAFPAVALDEDMDRDLFYSSYVLDLPAEATGTAAGRRLCTTTGTRTGRRSTC
jgi:hypothetical protein